MSDPSDTARQPTPLQLFDSLPRRRVRVAGGHGISAVDVGVGDPPVVLLHGNPTWSFQWRHVIPVVAAQRRTIAPDLLGFGRSDHPRIEYGWDVHLAAIFAFLDAVPPHTLVAHDWGASFGVRYAIDHPDRVRYRCAGWRTAEFEPFLDRASVP